MKNIYTTRGLSNCNPGNIEKSSTTWAGLAKEQTDPKFFIFISADYGIRAIYHILKTYFYVHKLQTIETIITRWAPDNENDTEAYIQSVSGHMNYPRSKILDFNNTALIASLVAAIIDEENGTEPYSQEEIVARMNIK